MHRVSNDAVVIGAGPAGATTAFMLASAGWSVAIVEKTRFPRRKVCGEYVSATNAPLLDTLGVAATFRQTAGPEVRRIGLLARKAVLTAPMPRGEGAADQWGRALGREKLDTLLLDQAQSAGAKLWQPYTAVELRTKDSSHVCRITARDGERELRAPIVVAAHGSWQRGPLPTQPSLPHRGSDLLAFKAHFCGCDLAPDLMPLLAFPGGYGGIVRRDGGLTTLSLCIRRDVLSSARNRLLEGRAAAAAFEHALVHCGGLRAIFRRARLEGPWLAAGPIRPGIRSGYAFDVFLVGNAAGEAHPIIAEGITMAMQGGYLLAQQLIASQECLTRPAERVRIGRDYSVRWRKLFAARTRAAALFAELAMRDRCIGWLLPVLAGCPSLLALGGALSGKKKALELPLAKVTKAAERLAAQSFDGGQMANESERQP
jgi:flavin-dependent dehydrogenase